MLAASGLKLSFIGDCFWTIAARNNGLLSAEGGVIEPTHHACIYSVS